MVSILFQFLQFHDLHDCSKWLVSLSHSSSISLGSLTMSFTFTLSYARTAKLMSYFLFLNQNWMSSFGQDLAIILISKSHIILVLIFPGILVCADTICLYYQTSVACTIPGRSSSIPNHTCSCITCMPVCCFTDYVVNCFILLFT